MKPFLKYDPFRVRTVICRLPWTLPTAINSDAFSVNRTRVRGGSVSIRHSVRAHIASDRVAGQAFLSRIRSGQAPIDNHPSAAAVQSAYLGSHSPALENAVQALRDSQSLHSVAKQSPRSDFHADEFENTDLIPPKRCAKPRLQS